MIEVGDRLPIDAIPGGTTLLCVGPPMAGKRQLALRLLAAGVTDDDTTVLISTDSSSAAVRAEYESGIANGTPQIGVVDCAGDAYGDPTDDDRTRHVSIPADLGSVGTTMLDLFETLGSGREDAVDRVGVLSLTTLALNTDPDKTIRFVHSLTETIEQRDGFGVLAAHADSLDRNELAQIQTFVDGTIEVREHGDGVEMYVSGLDSVPEGWLQVPVSPTARQDLDIPRPATPASGTSDPSPTAGELEFDSLAELIDQVDSDRPTLTVCNRESPDDRLETVESFFEDLNIQVRETTLGTENPRDVALLHRGPVQMASSPLNQLASGVATATADDDPFAARRGPDVLEALHERVFGARGVEKQFLIDASTAIEMTAWQTGGGTLIAGFQYLSRYWESPRSRRVMHRIADAGVDVHIYGVPDVVPNVDHPNVTVHPDSSEEIEASWFVTYDGDGRSDRTGTLVVRETDPEVYEGFWTYEPSISRDVFRYLSKTYGTLEESGQQAPS
jgi:KaiC/GvpD/RAD55 family RecA-like ATPase